MNDVTLLLPLPADRAEPVLLDHSATVGVPDKLHVRPLDN